MKKLIIIFLLFFVVIHTSKSQHILSKMGMKTHALIFITNKYQAKEWRKEKSNTRDAKKLAKPQK